MTRNDAQRLQTLVDRGGNITEEEFNLYTQVDLRGRKARIEGCLFRIRHHQGDAFLMDKKGGAVITKCTIRFENEDSSGRLRPYVPDVGSPRVAPLGNLFRSQATTTFTEGTRIGSPFTYVDSGSPRVRFSGITTSNGEG